MLQIYMFWEFGSGSSVVNKGINVPHVHCFFWTSCVFIGHLLNILCFVGHLDTNLSPKHAVLNGVIKKVFVD